MYIINLRMTQKLKKKLRLMFRKFLINAESDCLFRPYRI